MKQNAITFYSYKTVTVPREPEQDAKSTRLSIRSKNILKTPASHLLYQNIKAPQEIERSSRNLTWGRAKPAASQGLGMGNLSPTVPKEEIS